MILFRKGETKGVGLFFILRTSDPSRWWWILGTTMTDDDLYFTILFEKSLDIIEKPSLHKMIVTVGNLQLQYVRLCATIEFQTGPSKKWKALSESSSVGGQASCNGECYQLDIDATAKTEPNSLHCNSSTFVVNHNIRWCRCDAL